MFGKHEMDAMMLMQMYADQEVFMEVFGERLGTHLWDKFDENGMNLLNLARFLDNDNFGKLVAHIDGISRDLAGKDASFSSDEKVEPPHPNHLRWCVVEHGSDLLNWPEAARAWLVSSPSAGDYIRKHAPGFLSEAAEAVGRWHQMAMLDLLNSDGTYDYFPW